MKNISWTRTGLLLAVFAAIFAGSVSYAEAQATTTATTTPVSIMVMKHLCGNTIQNEDDLTDGEDKDSLQAFVNAHVACPNTALPGDEPASSTVAATRRNFGFILNFNQVETGTSTGSSTPMSKNLSEADYEQRQICGNEILGIDSGITGIASTTCLDSSRYNWSGISATGTVTVTENDPPEGYRFGAVMFTPTALLANNDADTLVSMSSTTLGQGTIVLDPAQDEATSTDRVITLHVFNFLHSTSTGTTTPPTNGTTTPPTGTTTPPTSTTTPPTSTTTPTTTPPILPGLDSSTLQVILNAIQRIQDIQDRLIDLLFQLADQD